MVNEGKIKLTDPVQNYLPSKVKLPIKNGKPITFLSLANHSSGLPRLANNMPFADPLNPYADYTVEMMYQFLNNYQLPREVGEQREYSNLGTGLLGHVLALIDNKSFEEMIIARVLTPLMMKNTFVDVPNSYSNKLSHGHNAQLEKIKYWQFPTLAGAGALKSNITDMALFLKANMAKSVLANEFALTQTSTANFANANTKIGLSWIIQNSRNGKLFIHNGGTGGFRSFIGFNRKTGKGIVLLSNAANSMDEIGHAYLTNSLEKVQLHQPVTVNGEQLKKLNGKFELVPGFALTVSNLQEQLFVQATGQQKLAFTPISTTEFVNNTVQAKIKCNVNEQGIAESLIMYQGGKYCRVKSCNVIFYIK